MPHGAGSGAAVFRPLAGLWALAGEGWRKQSWDSWRRGVTGAGHGRRCGKKGEEEERLGGGQRLGMRWRTTQPR